MLVNPLYRRDICYRLNGAPCARGWISTADCGYPRTVYDLAGAVVAGAEEVPCGDCPEEVIAIAASTTATGVDCAGAPITATGVGVVQTVPTPGAVQLVRLCDAATSYDREKQLLCTPTGAPVMVVTVWDASAIPGTAPTVEFYDHLGAQWTGDPATLTRCAAPETVDVGDAEFFCSDGVTFSRVSFWDITTVPPTLMVSLWQDASGAVVPPPPLAGLFPGHCGDYCTPIPPVGVIATWG